MSGTSMDGIDAVLVDLSTNRPHLLATHTEPWPAEVRDSLAEALAIPDPLNHNLQALDNRIGSCFANATNRLLSGCGVKPAEVSAIGSHGQTIRHEPDAETPYSLQIGNPERIAALTGIDVVADFRSADIRAGGQGAPLVPAFHRMFFSNAAENRCVLNIGGIANITVLPADPAAAVTGFDTGPGNTLMDNWIKLHRGARIDANGQWAASGTVSEALLEALLSDAYFRRPPPKSTGPEHFSIAWLVSHALAEKLEPADVQATLCALTSRSVTDAIREHAPGTERIMVCGGGAYNRELMQRLEKDAGGIKLESTAASGLKPDWVEAVAFAWLAKMRLEERPGNIPEVTGAKRAVLLGDVCRASGEKG
jgi:anhydro-N-acetylmuramic acid kinase